VSLEIDVERVSSVLLSDGWHTVQESSFDLDSYEFRRKGRALLGGGQETLVPAMGFSFKDNQGWIKGAVTSILAVRLKPAVD
jgi:hypothetical protein